MAPDVATLEESAPVLSPRGQTPTRHIGKDSRESSETLPAREILWRLRNAQTASLAGLARNSGHRGTWRRAPEACVTPQSGCHERVMF